MAACKTKGNDSAWISKYTVAAQIAFDLFESKEKAWSLQV